MGFLSKIKAGLSQKSKETPNGEAEGGGEVSSSSAPVATDLTSPVTPAASASASAKTSSITTIIVQPPPEQVEPSILPPPNPASTSQAPAPLSAPITDSETVAHPTSNDLDPWTRAYEIFQEREPKLMVDYKKHLQGDASTSVDFLSRQSVQTIVNKLLDDREKKQWQVQLLGHDIKIRTQVERLTKFLLWSDPFVKTAVSAQPYAALAWSGVSLLLPLLTSGTTQNEAMLKGFNSIGDLQIYWRICEETYLQSEHRQHYQDLIVPLANLYSYTIEYQVRVISHLSRAQGSRAWQDVTSSNGWAEMIEKINKFDKDFCSRFIPIGEQEEIRKNRDGQLEVMQGLQSILDEIRGILEEGGKQTQKYYDGQQERDLLQDLALAFAGPLHDNNPSENEDSGIEEYKNFNPQRVPHTCEWFFNDDRFRKWRCSSTSSLLWVSAGPGCGKSVLSRALIDEGRLSTSVTTSTICHFFFKNGDKRRMYSTNALCAILHQLFIQDLSGSLIKHALKTHKELGKSLPRNFLKLWEILENCVKSPETGEIVCLLDALDECDKSSSEKLIRKLENFYCQPQPPSKSSSKLKFLITGRPYLNLEISFRNFSGTTAYLRFDGDDQSEQIRQEIDLVIDARVQDIAAGFTADDRRKISDRLKSMDNRTYLWLHLTFDIIMNSPSEYGRRSDVEELLSELPSEVFDAYEEILNRSTKPSWAEIILQIVFAATRPLTLDEANVALTLALQKECFASQAALEDNLWPRDTFQRIMQTLCGLFISVYDSKLFFIHQTAREFLTHSKRKGNWIGRFNMPQSHGTISRSCISYLLLPDIDTPARDKPAEGKQRSLLTYGAAFWPLHYISQDDAEADHFRKDARMLCNTDRQATIWAPSYLEQRYLQWKDWTDLALASYLGLKQVVQDILLEEKTDIDMQGGDYYTALQAASAEGHQEIVQMLLEKGAGVNLQGGRDGTALYAASSRGHKKVVGTLLDKGADVNLRGGSSDRLSGTALYIASVKGYQEVVKMLLDKGADVDVNMLCREFQGRGDATALYVASEIGYTEIVKMLLDKGANVDLHCGGSSQYGTALYVASAKDHREVVKMLLDKGANVNLPGGGYGSGHYGTALYVASANGHHEVVKMLLDKDANANLQSSGSRGIRYSTALCEASKGGHTEIVKILLDKGANVNLRGGSDCGGGQERTALHTASERGHIEIVMMLLDKDADVNLYGSGGTALYAASEGGHTEIVKMLLHQGANVDILCNSRGCQERTALNAASEGGHTEIVKMLLDKGANVNLRGGSDYGSGRERTALHTASERGHIEIVMMLLDKDADVNLYGSGGTALYAASEGGHTEIVKMLLGNGVDVNLQGEDGTVQ